MRPNPRPQSQPDAFWDRFCSVTLVRKVVRSCRPVADCLFFSCRGLLRWAVKPRCWSTFSPTEARKNRWAVVCVSVWILCGFVVKMQFNLKVIINSPLHSSNRSLCPKLRFLLRTAFCPAQPLSNPQMWRRTSVRSPWLMLRLCGRGTPAWLLKLGSNRWTSSSRSRRQSGRRRSGTTREHPGTAPSTRTPSSGRAGVSASKGGVPHPHWTQTRAFRLSLHFFNVTHV